MQFLTQAQCGDWLKQAGRTAPTRSQLLALPREKRTNLENYRAARVSHLLRHSINQLEADHSATLLLQVFETGVWPSSEHLLSYSLIRRHFLSTGTIDDTPGHLAEGHEREFIFEIAFQCARFGWGFFVLSQAGPRVLILDHDGNFGLVDE